MGAPAMASANEQVFAERNRGLSQTVYGRPAAHTVGARPTPGGDDVVVQVRAAGLCFVEDALLTGVRRRGVLPRVLGHEGAGVVVECGAEVTDLPLGQNVLLMPRSGCLNCPACRRGRPELCRHPVILGQDVDGCWADFVRVPRAMVLPLPSSVSTEVGAVIACAGVSGYRAVCQVITEPGNTVLVRGIGTGIGLYAALIAKAFGSAHVVGTVRSDTHAAALSDLGIEVVVTGSDDPVKNLAAVKSVAGHGFDAMIDAVSGWEGQDYSRVVTRGGRIVFVGDLTGQSVPINPSLLIYRGISLSTAGAGSISDTERLLKLIALGQVDLPVTAHPGGTAAIARLLETPALRHTSVGRDVCTW